MGIVWALLLKQWIQNAGWNAGKYDFVAEVHCFLILFTHELYCYKVE